MFTFLAHSGRLFKIDFALLSITMRLVIVAYRTIGTDRSSLYSGHVAASAAASFFAAKVYCDYHPELGCNKYLIYGAAAIPPLSWVCQIESTRTFSTDILVGLGVGASCGILIPEFHRIQDRNISLGSIFLSPKQQDWQLRGIQIFKLK